MVFYLGQASRWITSVLTLLLSLAPAVSATTGADGASAQSYEIDLPRQPLPDALSALSAITGLQVIYEGAVPFTIDAPALAGSLRPDQALDRLLAGSGLIARRIAPGSVAISPTADATAEDETAVLDPIIVEGRREDPTGPVDGFRATRSSTGTRIDAPLEELPLSVQVVPREVIDAANANRVEDALILGSTVALGDTTGGLGDSFLIRGFEATVTENGTVNSDPTLDRRRDAANVERIEILSGSSGALFGFGPAGGVVNVITKKPQEEPFVRTRTEISSLRRLRQEFDFNQPLSEAGDTAFRIIGAVEGSDSFRFRDAFDVTFTENRQFIAPSLALQPTEDISILLSVQYLRDSVVFDRGLPVSADGEVLSDTSDFFGDPSFDNTIVQQTQADLKVDYDLNDDWGITAQAVFDRNTIRGTRVEADLLSPITVDEAFLVSAGVPAVAAPAVLASLGFPIPVVAEDTILRNLEDVESINQNIFGRLDLSGSFITGPFEHEAVISIETQSRLFNNTLKTTGAFENFDFVSVSDPAAPTTLTEDLLVDALVFETDIDTISVSIIDKISLRDRIHILGGGRIDHLDQDTTDLVNDSFERVTTTQFSPRAGIVVEPFAGTPLSVFFSYGQSFEANTAPAEGGGVIDPQRGRTFEGGLTYTFNDAAFEVGVTAFDTRLENVPVGTLAGEFSVASMQRSRGIEVSAKGALTPNLKVIANYSFIDSELESVDGGGIEDAVGESIPGVSKHTFSLLGSYNFNQGALDGLSLTGAMRFIGSRLLTNSTSDTLVLSGIPISLDAPAIDADASVRIDLSASYEISEGLVIEGGVQNLLNEEILRPQGTSAGLALVEPPLIGFVGLTAQF